MNAILIFVKAGSERGRTGSIWSTMSGDTTMALMCVNGRKEQILHTEWRLQASAQFASRGGITRQSYEATMKADRIGHTSIDSNRRRVGLMVTGIAQVKTQQASTHRPTLGAVRMNDPVELQAAPGLGHNSGQLCIEIELRLFNRVRHLVGDGIMHRKLELPAASTIGDVLERVGIPSSEIFIAFINGRDVSLAPGVLRLERPLEEGDVLALSGPVPYSWGYGAPVV